MTEPRSARVTLTERDRNSRIGSELLEVLARILEDGRISVSEVQELEKWIARASDVSNLPAIRFLGEEVAAILADGSISEAENRLLQKAVLRVMPPIERERAKARIAEAKAADRALKAEVQRAAENRATERQLAFIRDLGGTCPAEATKEQASALIEQLLASRPTVRQRMVLRFWNRPDLNSAGVDGVSAWMDEWYEKDPDHLEAWELWKSEGAGREGRDPSAIEQVPLGAGQQYLARVKSGARRTNSADRAAHIMPAISRTWFLVAVAVLVAAYLVMR